MFYRFFYRPRQKFLGWWRKSTYLKTNLPLSSWIDKVELIREALFYAVDDFVSKEGEDAFAIVDWEDNETHRRVKHRIIEILHWYHIERPERQKELERRLAEDFVTWVEFEMKTDKKDVYYTKMVCSIRLFLWT